MEPHETFFDLVSVLPLLCGNCGASDTELHMACAVTTRLELGEMEPAVEGGVKVDVTVLPSTSVAVAMVCRGCNKSVKFGALDANVAETRDELWTASL